MLAYYVHLCTMYMYVIMYNIYILITFNCANENYMRIQVLADFCSYIIVQFNAIAFGSPVKFNNASGDILNGLLLG